MKVCLSTLSITPQPVGLLRWRRFQTASRLVSQMLRKQSDQMADFFIPDTLNDQNTT